MQYDIPYSESRRWDYLHNWYLSKSQYPYYLNTGAKTLYVMYPSANEVVNLVYDGQVWRPTITVIEDEKQFPALVKLFLSAYFHQRQIYVSNDDFYLPVYLTAGGNAKVLKIRVAQQWKENEFYEFALLDRATTMVKADNIKKGNMQGAYYAIDHKDGLPVLRRLNPKKITQAHIQQGVYRHLKQKKYKTTVRYLSVGNEEALKRCRVYPLWHFTDDLVDYFNLVGIPFRLKELPYQKVNVLPSSKFAQERQIDLSALTVCVVDDRIRPQIHPELESPTFSSELMEIIQSLLPQGNGAPTLVLKTKANLQAGALVLRLQDNQASDFKVEISTDEEGNEIKLNKALLYNYSDPYKDYAEEYAYTVSQSLNINRLTETEEESFDDDEADAQPAKKKVPLEPQSEEAYLGYKKPSKTKLKIPLLNSLYQLYLKDIVRHPENARQRLEVLNRMRNNIFLYAEGLVYLEGDALVFMRTTNNSEAESLLKKRTGRDLMTDVLLPALNRKKYPDYEDIEDEDQKNILKNCRFIVHPDYVWQIDDSPERVLHNIPEIQRRLRVMSKERPKEDFRPTYKSPELAVFGEEQLQAYEYFLDEEVEEAYISFNTLTRKYGKRKEGKEDTGFYRLLGIKNSAKFKKYVTAKLGITFGSPKGKDVIPAYTGISYVPETQQYYVGDKYGISERYRQDKGFVFRRVVVHDGDTTPDTLFELLKLNLFPLLEVNFIRYKQYTVYPFPFKLIEIWKKCRGQ